jgi:DNA-directed RNA polymerase specialized sigma24 family protein
MEVVPPVVAAGAEEILAVHEALDRLSQHDPRMTHVVEMRYFGGLTEDEIAGALGVTACTVRREWEKARWLLRETLVCAAVDAASARPPSRKKGSGFVFGDTQKHAP